MMLLNGREIILHGAEEPYPLTSDTRYNGGMYAREAINAAGIARTPVSDLFFSAHNIDILQDGIRYLVYVRSDKRHVIDRQSDTDLLVVMRGVFNEDARHMPCDVVEQVRRLNTSVLNYVVPRILAEIGMYLKYRYDVTTIATPLERARNMSSKGSRQLELRAL